MYLVAHRMRKPRMPPIARMHVEMKDEQCQGEKKKRKSARLSLTSSRKDPAHFFSQWNGLFSPWWMDVIIPVGEKSASLLTQASILH